MTGKWTKISYALLCGVALTAWLPHGVIAQTAINLVEWAGSNLGVPTAWGTAPSGNVAGVNANVLVSNATQINGVTRLVGAGAVGTGAPRVAVGVDSSTSAGCAPGTAGSPGSCVLTVQGASGGFAMPVSGTFWQATQPISVASLPLPAGAATAANQHVTAAGTSDTAAQAFQGVVGGVAVPTTSADVVAALNALSLTQPFAMYRYGDKTYAAQGGTGAALLTNTAVSVNASAAGQLQGYHFCNPNASIVYVQFFDALPGSVTVGTTPNKFPVQIPVSSCKDVDNLGIQFSTSITVAATTGATNGTAPGTGIFASPITWH